MLVIHSRYVGFSIAAFRIIRNITALFILVLATSYTTSAAIVTANQVIPLNDNWKFYRGDIPDAQLLTIDDSRWETVVLPHTWNNLDGQDGNGYYRGAGWYRTRIHNLNIGSDRHYYVQFDAAALTADVYVNGQFVGRHEGGFAAFRFEITKQLDPRQDNLIAVKVDNSQHNTIGPLQGDFTLCGGLYRQARIISKGEIHLAMDDYGSTGVYITPSHVTSESAQLEILTKVRNELGYERNIEVTSDIRDTNNKRIQCLTTEQTVPAHSTVDFIQQTKILKPHLWQGVESPYLYHVETHIDDRNGHMDNGVNPLGFRSFSVDPVNGFMLNGKKIDLHGVNKHQDQWNKGWAESESDQRRDIDILKDLGSTAIRLAHYQHPNYTYDLCDQSGLVTWAEVANTGVVSKDNAYTQNIIQQFTELVKQNYNHPSICFWSLANEITNGPDPTDVLKALNDVSHKLDQSRPTTIAINQWQGHSTNFIPDIDAFNRYYGWYYGKFPEFETFLDSTHKSYPGMSIGVSEYGAGASAFIHTEHPIRMDHSEEYQALYHEAYWDILKKRPWLWCKFIWVGMDFASDGRQEGDTSGRNDKGIISADRTVYKDVFYFYQANWSKNPVLHITGRRYNDRPGLSRDIKVYSNAKSVSLMINGVEQPSKTSSNCIFKWYAMPMQMGRNTVTATAEFHGKTVTDTVIWDVPSGGPNDGIYSLLNQGSGMVLEHGSKPYPVQYTISGHRTCLFEIEHADNGFYKIRNVVSRLYLTAEGATLSFSNPSNNKSQLWSIQQLNGAYRITNAESGLFLEAPTTGNCAGSSIRITQETRDLNQQWVLNPAYQMTGGRYRLICNRKILKNDAGNNAVIADIWNITALGNGYYTIINTKTKRALISSGDKVTTRKPNGSADEQWSIQMVNEGFLIQSRGSHQALDIKNGIHTEAVSADNTQVWILTKEL